MQEEGEIQRRLLPFKSQKFRERDGEKEEERKKKKRRTVHSLGWLKESLIMPKRVKAIECAEASSIIELKAQLYHFQEESNKSRDLTDPDVEYQRAKKIVSICDHLSRRNFGVEACSHKISSPVNNTPNWCPRGLTAILRNLQELWWKIN